MESRSKQAVRAGPRQPTYLPISNLNGEKTVAVEASRGPVGREKQGEGMGMGMGAAASTTATTWAVKSTSLVRDMGQADGKGV